MVSRTPGHHVAVIGPFPPIKGGIAQHTACVADALEDAGCSVQRHGWANQYPRFLYGRDEADRSAAPDPAVKTNLRWYSPLSWVRAGRQARRSKLVLFPWVTPVHALPQLLWLWLCRGSRRVMHVHNVTPHESFPLATTWARLVLARADLLVCHAQAIADELDAIGVRTTVKVTPHAPNLAVVPGPPPVTPPTRLLFLGTIRAYKGLPVAVGAADLLCRTGRCDVTITIAGEAWERGELPNERDVEDLMVPIEIRSRYIPDAELVELLQSHHIVVAPYRTATQSGVIPLAFAAGRPVVATRVGGLTEIVEEGRNGALAEPNSVSDFADAVERVAADLAQLCAGALASAVSWSDYARLLLRDP